MAFLKGNAPWNKAKQNVQHHSPETKKKIGDAVREREVSDITRKKESIAAVERQNRLWQNPDYRKMMSEAHIGNPALNLTQLHSEESRKKGAETKRRMYAEGVLVPWSKGKSKEEDPRIKTPSTAFKKGSIPWSLGKSLPPHTEEHKMRQSEGLKEAYRSGRMKPWHKDIPTPKDVRDKISESMKSVVQKGENNPNWKGGLKVAWARTNSRRNRELGFIPLNEWESNNPNFIGHHMDKEHVIYIPQSLHDSVRHMQKNQESMDRINELVINWYVEYYGLRR